MIKKKLICIRRFTQSIFLFVFIYILWSATYPLRSFLAPEIFFKINPLIVFSAGLAERLILKGAVLTVSMIMFTLILGRFFCGWMCPVGTMIDIAGGLTKTKKSLPLMINNRLKNFKFYILLSIALLSLWGIQAAWALDPVVIMARFISFNFIPAATFIMEEALISLIKFFNLYTPLLDFYRMLKGSILGVKAHYFSNAGIIFFIFLSICSLSLLIRRFWCRILCPLGALYAVLTRFSWLERITSGCIFCTKCKVDCRMQAIRPDISYDKPECILCMDCIYSCPKSITKFCFIRKDESKVKSKNLNKQKGISRRDFLLLGVIATSAFFFRFRHKNDNILKNSFIIRPPGALEENKFLNRCVRCGNCMKVCPTNGLQPVSLESGLSGLWTPQLVPEIGYCEYNCNLCGNVCPTDAIPRLEVKKKQKMRLGLAKINRNLCLPWKKKKECIVCEEHCPIPDKAIKLKKERIEGKTVLRPYIDMELCNGCGICVTKCPTRPLRSIKIFAIRTDRTLQ